MLCHFVIVLHPYIGQELLEGHLVEVLGRSGWIMCGAVEMRQLLSPVPARLLEYMTVITLKMQV